METLSKENFWNEIEEKYPQAIAYFRTWIDNYKREVNWDDLFGNKKIKQRKKYWADIKFHHIPIFMQLGILRRFELELKANGDYERIMAKAPEMVKGIFSDLEEVMSKKNK